MSKKADGRLLLLVPTSSYRIGDFLAAAGRLGVDVTVGSNQDAVLAHLTPANTIKIELDDLDVGVLEICRFDASYPLTAIIGVDQETTYLASLASESLGLPHNPPSAVEAAENKHRFRIRMANSGLPTPWFTLLPIADVIRSQVADLPYPVVLKPLTLSASRGVIRADNAEEFVTAANRIRKILSTTACQGQALDNILVEDYVPGQEVAVEGMLDAGKLTVLALFDKPDPLVGPYFEETIYVTPSRLPIRTQSEITTTVGHAVARLGLQEGAIHAEVRINKDGVWPIEIAPRSIGGQCARSLEFGAAGRLEDILIRHAMKLPQHIETEVNLASGVMMIPIPAAGVLRNVQGIDDARSMAGIQDVTITIPTGDTLTPVPEGNRYLGFIFSRGETPNEVEASLRAAHNVLDFAIEPGD